MRRHYQHSGTLTFDWVTHSDEISLVATCEYDAGDPSSGMWAGWFIRDVVVAEAVILDREAVERYLPGERDRIEDHAGSLYEDLADDARAEQQAARDEEPDDREDW